MGTVSFMMTTTLMNIFIAVLSEQYHRAFKGAAPRFFRARAEISLDYKIMISGIQRLFCLKRCRFRRFNAYSDWNRPPSQIEDLGEAKYLWYALAETETMSLG